MRFKSFLRVGVFAGSASFSSCASVTHEPIRIDNPSDLSATNLRFSSSTSSIQALRRMQRFRLTGISTTEYTAAGLPLLGALTADYQSRVHIFQDGRYIQSLSLQSPRDSLTYGFGLTFARYHSNLFLLVLYSDPLAHTNQRVSCAPAVLDVFQRTAQGTFTHFTQIELRSLSARHDGLSSPLFVGHDLEAGVFFLARNDEGELWQNGYWIRLRDGQFTRTPVSLSEAAECPCISNYIYGNPEEK